MAEADPGLPTQAIWDIPFENLEFLERIGKGSFGSVFKGLYLGLDVAIKKIEKADDPEYLKYIDREVSMLQSLRHPFIVNFSGICVHSTGLYIVTEFVSGGDVRQLLKQTPPIGWEKRISIALDLAKAMVFLHAKKIIHRDLKSKNILLDEYQKIRLCDFGFARMSEQTKKSRHMTMCGTEGWVAPEILLGMSYDTSCDVFSFGVVLAELITGKKPGVDLWVRSPETCFDINPDELSSKAISGAPQKLMDICVECCMYEPLTRPKFDEILAQLKIVQTEYNLYQKSIVPTPPITPTPVVTVVPPTPTTPPPTHANIASQSPDVNTITTGVQQMYQQQPQQQQQPAISLAQSRRNTMSLHRKSIEILNDNNNNNNNNNKERTNTLVNGRTLNNSNESTWRVGSLKPAGYFTLKRKNGGGTPLPPVLASHIVKMIERATSDYHYDTSYIQDLLLTYRCFSTPAQIFDLLLSRYIANSPDNFLNDINSWKKTQKVIQLRVIIFLKRWIDAYPTDFFQDGMEEKLGEFDRVISYQNANTLLTTTLTVNTATELEPKLLTELGKKRIELSSNNNTPNSSSSTSPSTSPDNQSILNLTNNNSNNSNSNNNNNNNNNNSLNGSSGNYPISIIPPPPQVGQEYLEIVDIHPHELARQITIINGSWFRSIKPREYMEYIWEKFCETPSPWVGSDLTHRPAENIHNLIAKSKDIVRLVQTEIVKQTQISKRASTIERFIEAADKCLSHYDYSAVFAIIESLSDSSIQRLSDTWRQVSPRVMAQYETLKNLASKENDHKKYRESVQDAQTPCIPYFDFLLDELSFIETSSPRLLPGGIVNFFHYRQLSRKILQSQQLISPTPHVFRPIPSIQKVLNKPPQELFDSEAVKHYSLKCEPPVSL